MKLPIDHRYTVRIRHSPNRKKVVRFCGKWIGQCNTMAGVSAIVEDHMAHRTQEEAEFGV